MNNNTDITYSFNLDNYINSLESNLPFNDYKILVNNKDYNTFIKRIIAKIYELTLRSKNGLYKQFKSAIFTSVDIPIKDRKLNPNMMNDMEKYCEMIEKWKIEWGKRMNHLNDDSEENINDLMEMINMHTVLYEIREDGGTVKKYIDKIFYSEGEKYRTTIREYFGCNAGQTPKQIEILSDEYKEKLVKVKNETEKFLKELKVNKDKYLTYLKNSKNDLAESIIELFQKIVKNITYFHNMNYTFFIKAVQVRSKVAKYITKASLGNGVFTQMKEGMRNGKPFVINTYYGMDFEVFRDIPDTRNEIQFGEDKALVVTRSDIRAVIISCTLTKGSDFSNELYDLVGKHAVGMWNIGDFLGEHKDFKLFKDKLFSFLMKGGDDNETMKANYFKYRQTKEHLEIFPKLQSLFKIPVDITKFCTILHMGTFNSQTKMYNDEDEYLLPDRNFIIFMALGNEKYNITEKDELFHTSLDELPYLQGFYRNNYAFSEQRIYFGANIPMTPNGDLFKEVWKGGVKRIYKMSVNPGETIYKDPEFYAYKTRKDYTRADRTACYILKDKINIQDVTEMFLSKPEWTPDASDEKETDE